jgi:nitroimidazol reductase NimA-like FMN-containing flavoprotein (pyridoxamine 5'-phosphate oxidase superfamily)
MPKATHGTTEPRASRPEMPGYGINEDAQIGLLPWKWAADRLTKTQNYFLVTTRSDGRPHVMPIWGVWMNNQFYFSSGKKSVKTRNLKANANCVLCAGGADEAVILEGKAIKVGGKDVLKEFAAVYSRKYKFDPSTMNEPVFAIRPKVVFGQIEKTFTDTATRWTFWGGAHT